MPYRPQIAVGTVRQGEDLGLVPFEDSQFGPAAQVPDAYAEVEPGRRRPAAVGRRRYGTDGMRMFSERLLQGRPRFHERRAERPQPRSGRIAPNLLDKPGVIGLAALQQPARYLSRELRRVGREHVESEPQRIAQAGQGGIRRDLIEVTKHGRGALRSEFHPQPLEIQQEGSRLLCASRRDQVVRQLGKAARLVCAPRASCAPGLFEVFNERRVGFDEQAAWPLPGQCHAQIAPKHREPELVVKEVHQAFSGGFFLGAQVRFERATEAHPAHARDVSKRSEQVQHFGFEQPRYSIRV